MSLFCQFDAKFMADIKMRRAGPMARCLYFQAVAWSRENETDGKVEPEFFGDVAVDIKQPAKHFAKLAEVGLMEPSNDGGYCIPIEVWVKWNPTRRDLEAKRAKKSDAGSRGAHVRWEHSPSNAHDWCEACHEAGYLVKRDDDAYQADSNPITPAIAPAMANGWQSDGRAIAIPDTSLPQNRIASPSSILRDDPSGTVDNSEEEEGVSKKRHIIDSEAKRRLRERSGAKPVGNENRWLETVTKSIQEEHGAEIDRIISEYPTAPYDVVASAAIHGERRSLAHHARHTTEQAKSA